MDADEPPPSPRKPRVAVVFGGRSPEHAVSCVSAGSVLRAIDRTAYDVVPIGITAAGRWVFERDEPERLAFGPGYRPSVDPAGTVVVLGADPAARGLIVREPTALSHELVGIDVVFPVLHGPYGEDGTIQGLLELAGIPYVGSGVFASAAAMDKGHSKALLAAAGLPVGPHVVVGPRQWRDDPAAVRAAVDALGMPVFVKPARAGSSLGITKVKTLDDLDAAIGQARRNDPRIVVEAAIEGREIECGVLEGLAGDGPQTSVVAEITVVGDHEFYDFTAKYLDGTTRLDVPADVPGEVAARLRAMASAAYEALSCEGLARVDFFLRRDGSIVVNEVNTMPGFTPTSMFPLLWAASGLDYPALVGRLIRTALARTPGLR